MSAEAARGVSFAPRRGREPAAPKQPVPSLSQLVALRQTLWHAALEPSTRNRYERAMKAWATFARSLSLPHFPTAENLSLFVTFRCQFAIPSTIRGELSGMAYYFKAIDAERWEQARSDVDVARVLIGAAKLAPHSPNQAIPLPLPLLSTALSSLLSLSSSYDELLWAALSVVAFFSCARGQEITAYDDPELRDKKKYSLRSTVRLTKEGFAVHLPYHKSDPLYTGSRLSFAASDASSLLTIVRVYLAVRDELFGEAGYLWLRENGEVPTRKWWVERVQQRCGKEFSGHSFRAGGATWYAMRGVSENTIKRIGRWKSDTWQLYVRTSWDVDVALRNAEAGGPPTASPPTFDDSSLLPLLS